MYSYVRLEQHRCPYRVLQLHLLAYGGHRSHRWSGMEVQKTQNGAPYQVSHRTCSGLRTHMFYLGPIAIHLRQRERVHRSRDIIHRFSRVFFLFLQ